MGCLVGLGVIFTCELVGEFYRCDSLKQLQYLSALVFDFNFWIAFSDVKNQHTAYVNTNLAKIHPTVQKMTRPTKSQERIKHTF